MNPESIKGQTVVVWHSWSGDASAQVNEIAKSFTRTNEWGIRVEVRSWYGNAALFDAVKTAKPAEMPQVLIAPSEMLAFWMQSGLAVDLNASLNEEPSLKQTFSSAFFPTYGQQDTDETGKRSGLPIQRDAQALIYNQTWGKELGIQKPPQTPAEFKKAVCAAAKVNAKEYDITKHGTGGLLVDHHALTSLSWLASFGADPIPAKAGDNYHFDSAEGAQALAFLRDLMDSGCAWEGRNDVPYDYFANRMMLFYSGNMQDVINQGRAMQQAKSSDQWILIPFPSEKGKPFIFSGGDSVGILQSSKEQQAAAWAFLRYIEQPENLVILEKTLPSLPLGQTSADALKGEAQNFPWSQFAAVQPYVRPAPSLASWYRTRGIMEDAFWQLYRLPTNQMKYVLPQLDTITQELLNRKP